MKFLIQSVNKQIVHDFSFYLIEAINYQNWYNKGKEYFEPITYILSDKVPYNWQFNDYIPIGTVEFVHIFYKRFYAMKELEPINIPIWLMDNTMTKGNKEYIKEFCKKNEIDPVFIKSTEKIKDDSYILHLKELDNYLSNRGKYFAREILDFESEWRYFIFNNRIVGVNNYSGDPTLFPANPDSLVFVYDIIEKYKDQPPSYTIDIGLESGSNRTRLIEMHHFYSCGFYGFNDQTIIPQMFSQWHHWHIRNNK